MSHPSKAHMYIFNSKLNHLRKDFENTQPDVTLISAIDDVKVEAHQEVLSAASDYFEAMFRTEMKETQTSEVRLDHMDGATLKMLIDYIYTSKIKLERENMQKMLRAAHYFQINALLGVCWDFMETQLDYSNCLGISLVAEKYGNSELFRKSLELTCMVLEEMFNGQEFLELNVEQLDMLLTKIGCRYRLQEIFFCGLVAWCQYYEEKRQKFLSNLLSKHIRFGWLDPKLIAEKGHQISEILKSSELMDTWLKWHSSPESRETKEKKLAIMFVLEQQEHFVVKLYNEDLKAWSCEEWPNPYGKARFSTVVVKNKLIIATGRYLTEGSKIVNCLDLQTMKWSQLPPMSNRPASPALAEVNGNLYVIDRYGGSNEKYDSSTREWQCLEPLSLNNLYQTAVATCNGQIYAAQDKSSDVYCYDPVNNIWHSKPSAREDTKIKGDNVKKVISSERRNLAQNDFHMAGLNGYLYVYGAQLIGMTKTLQRYDPSNGEWKCIKSIHKCFNFCAHNGRLYAMYGDILNFGVFVEEYIPETEEWNRLPLNSFSEADFPVWKNNIYIFSV